MSELSLPRCPICAARDSFLRQSLDRGGQSFEWYECRECGSVLLSIGDDRWAYQKIGRAGQAHLLKRPMTRAELLALANVPGPAPQAAPAGTPGPAAPPSSQASNGRKTSTSLKDLACKSCGAALQVSSDSSQVVCAFCGSTFALEWGDGIVALKAVEETRRAVREIGDETKLAIREGADATRTEIREGTDATTKELRRLQLTHELSAAQMSMSSIRAEIRSLERQKLTRKGKQQLKELKEQEREIGTRISALQSALARSSGIKAANTAAGKDWTTAFVLCLFLGIFGVHRFYTGYTAIGFVQLVTLGGFLIWWLIDLFLIVIRQYKDSRRNLLANSQSPGAQGCLWAFVAFIAIGFVVSLTGLIPVAAVLAVAGAIGVYFLVSSRHRQQDRS
jgi:uncharacterized Zn finger protein (UPF0148 family)